MHNQLVPSMALAEHPLITVAVVTRNAERTIAACLESINDSGVADEVAVFVDRESTDRTAEISGRYTTHVSAIDVPLHVQPIEALVASKCSGDIILRVDDDETLVGNWRREDIVTLLRRTKATHLHIVRRWLVEDGERFIASAPWFPDMQMRLYLNRRELVAWPKRLHEPIKLAGPCAVYMDGWFDHHVLRLLDRVAREAKCKRYLEICPAPDLSRYYLFEDERVILHAASATEFAASMRLSERVLASWPRDALRPRWLDSFLARSVGD